MNERIKLLAEQAGIGPWGITIDKSTEIFQKFAELIVRECINVLDGKIYESIDHEGNETWPDLILKEHFGVEE